MEDNLILNIFVVPLRDETAFVSYPGDFALVQTCLRNPEKPGHESEALSSNSSQRLRLCRSYPHFIADAREDGLKDIFHGMITKENFAVKWLGPSKA